jgi:Rod binding domain-containing protein
MSDLLKSVGDLGGLARSGYEAAKGEQAVKQVIRTAQQAANGAKSAGDKKLDDAAMQFESMLLKQMFSSMWSAVPQEGILSGSREEEIYRDMLNQAIADATSKGQGLGIKEVIKKELMRHEKG